MTAIAVIILLLINYTCAQEDTNKTEPEHEAVTKLDLSSKGLTSLKEYDFSKYPLLEEIDLSNNELEHIKEDAFLKNKNLTKINLSGNKKLQLRKFSTLLVSDIQELNLSNCNIEKLSVNIFDGLRYLKTIDLSNNPIKKKGLLVRSLLTIEALDKIILPNENPHLLKELCQEFINITIIIKTDENEKPVECKNYLTIKDEEDEDEDEEEKDEQTKTVEVPAPGSLSTQVEKDENVLVNISRTETNKTVDISKINENPLEVSNAKPLSEAKADDADKSENATVHEVSAVIPETIPMLEPATNNTDESHKQLHEEKPHLEPRVPDETKEIKNETVVVPETIKCSSDTCKTNEDTVLEKDNKNEQCNNGSCKTQQTSNDPPKEKDNKEEKQPALDSAKSIPETVNPNIKETKVAIDSGVASQTNMSEKMQISEEEKVAKVTESSNTGSTILIVLVIAVVVAGIAAFGYKFYHNRTHQSSEPVERELKEIVATKPSSEDPIRDITEQEPLMNNHLNKENGDPKPNQSQMVSNHLSTGPYQPTTTTFKPIDQTDDNNK